MKTLITIVVLFSSFNAMSLTISQKFSKWKQVEALCSYAKEICVTDLLPSGRYNQLIKNCTQFHSKNDDEAISSCAYLRANIETLGPKYIKGKAECRKAKRLCKKAFK